MVTDDTPNKEDVLMIFDVLKVQNWPGSEETTFPQNFIVAQLASSRQSVSWLHYMSWTTAHVD